MTGLTMADLEVGEAAQATFTVTTETIREFVRASGDDNPIHSDARFAAGTRFGRVIAPGMLTASFVSSVIGTRLPGPGTLYLSQSLRFLRPVYVGDRVTARVEVVERLLERDRVQLRTTCVNQAGELVLEGDAWVRPSPARVEYTAARATPPLFVPAALALEATALWMRGSLALATHLFGLGRMAAGPPAGAAEPDPVRP
jgi:3-hydroxybutyryl-CoA dehydratase